MMRKILLGFLALGMSAFAWGATAKPPAKAPAKKSASGKPAKNTAARGGKKPAPSRTTWRNRQSVPSPERYKEIQEALAAKGYMRPEAAAGSWDQSSMDALKRFQADQNLESNGKINSVSLIALGLGPKRDAVAAPPKPPSQTPEAPAGR